MDGTSKSRFGIRIVVALPCEAAPLLSRFDLEPASGDHPYRVYHDQSELHWLIVTGVGRHAAGIATAYLAGLSCSTKAIAWLNLGVAGHATIPLGEARAAHKITDTALGTAYYPPVIFEGLKTEALVTVTEPQKAISAKMLVDMEASGFYASASNFASPELVHCIKIVSDHGVEAGERFSKTAVTLHIEKQLGAICDAAEQLLDLSNTFATRWADPAYLDTILAEYHFSPGQQQQLRQLLQRWQVLLEDQDVVDYVWKHAATGSEVIDCLTQRLSQVPFTLPDSPRH
ncbi:MAG: hypothetical protein P1U82_21200 [Verrucomicrobiales bacterium]|jgi:nucleoside phosphorylase|nr:hypothetical protein [Verrucomicrobiales bacterium]